VEIFKSKQEKVRKNTGDLASLVDLFYMATDNNDEQKKNNLMHLIYPEFKKILGAARRRFHFQSADHENLVSNVLVAFLRGIIKPSVRFDANKGSLSNWLFMLYYRKASDFFETKAQHEASFTGFGENHRIFAIDSLAEANVFYKDSLRGSLAFADKQFSNLEAYVWKRTIDDASLDDLIFETGFSRSYLSKIRYKVSLACQGFFMPA